VSRGFLQILPKLGSSFLIPDITKSPIYSQKKPPKKFCGAEQSSDPRHRLAFEFAGSTLNHISLFAVGVTVLFSS
jgi:hypothetical protein